LVNRELIEVFSEIAREKNVERSELATILEELFLYVIEKEYGDSSNCSCIVNLDKGEIEIYAEKTKERKSTIIKLKSLLMKL
jgi:NusA N-terminal domain.